MAQWDDCARLVASCIIYYNSALLSRLLIQAQKLKNEEAIKLFARFSPIAWVHIQLTGYYNFGNKPMAIDLENIIEGIGPLDGVLRSIFER